MPELADPWPLVQTWLAEAKADQRLWSDAFILATATRGGRPSARAVVLRGLDERGLVFFTDEDSRKGRELAENPVAAAVFVWPSQHRELRVEGSVSTLAGDEADAVFAERPAQARLPLWAWRQGEVVAGSAELADRLGRAQADHPDGTGGEVPRPPYWLGYRLRPDLVEFWEERPYGLHERIRHRREDGGWGVERLAP